MRVLVIGGCGYIGSHMVKLLLERGDEVVIIDDLSSGRRDALLGGELIEADLGDSESLGRVLRMYRFDAVMHFASLIQVGESRLAPGRYYETNVGKTISLLNTLVEHQVNKLIFSSTAAVYGDPLYTPIDEAHPCNPINPYGKSKHYVEGILGDFDRAYGLKSVSLRYFNAAGADPLSRIGERHEPETHLIPLAIRSALGLGDALKVFGTDYETPDGTAIRDYIHVDDLAIAHYLALRYLFEGNESRKLNLGTGKGFSVMEILKAVEIISGKPVRRTYELRRQGDPSVLVADAGAARRLLAWSPKFSALTSIVESAYRWELKAKSGFA